MINYIHGCVMEQAEYTLVTINTVCDIINMLPCVCRLIAASQSKWFKSKKVQNHQN